jgi:YD repeat-containing protein
MPTQPGTACSTTATPYNWYYNFVGTEESITQDPDGGVTTTLFNDFSPADWSAGTFNAGLTPWYAGLVYYVQHPDGSTTEQLWQQNFPYALTDTRTVTAAGTSAEPGNPVVAATIQQNTNAQFTATSFSYDRNGNVVLRDDYDWKAYTASNVPHATVNGQMGPTALYSPGNLLRATATTFATQAGAATSAGAGTDDTSAYWNPMTNPGAGLNWPLATKLQACVSVTGTGNGSVTQYQYDSGGTIAKGNLTQEAEWNSSAASSQPPCTTALTSSNAVVHSWIYDSHGNVTQTTDANAKTTTVAYDSNDLYPSTRTDPLNRVTSFTFDQGTGLLSSQMDYNGLTQTHTRDNLGREIQLLEKGSSGLLRETTTSYEDANRRVVTKSDNATPGDQQLDSVTDYDQLGRVRLTRQLETSSQSADSDTDGIKVQTRYGYSNPLSYRIVSNPYRASTSSGAGSETTMGWTVSTSDWSHRVSASTFYAGAGSPTPSAVTACPTAGSSVSCYSGNTTTSADEAGVTRTNTVDGLGRLVTVVENGIGATTSYSYDVLGNLTSVTQSGVSGRSFAYNSLSRLVSATNPESGLTCYGLIVSAACAASYDGNGNLLNRTDARGAVAAMTYDAVNRLTGKSYSGAASAPSVTYSYVNGTDFLSSVSSSAATYTYSNFDAYGRPGAGVQTVGSQSWTFPSVAWTPQGQVASVTYPSGRMVTTQFDPAGRVAGVSGLLSGATTQYVGSTSYAAHGGLSVWTGGDGLARSMGYNARLQTTSLGTSSGLISLGLNWAANGTLTSQTVTRPFLSATQTYAYDGVNRLCVAAEAASAVSIPSCSASLSGNTWQQWYTYDNVGNRAVVSNNSGQNSSLISANYTPQASAPGSSVPFSSLNRWNLAAGYDAAGNTTSVNTQTMVYDAESRMTSWVDSSVSGSAVTLTYDGDGRRISKSSAAGATTYVYDPAGNLAVEVGGSAASSNSTAYLTADHLGSVRLVTSSSGACVGAHDYLPFGEEIPGSLGRGSVPCYPAADAQTDTTWKFGGQERDAENGFDNFLARHLGSSMGRFFSVDPGNGG